MDYIIDLSALDKIKRASVYKAIYLKEHGGTLPNHIRALNSLSCTALYARTDREGKRILLGQNGHSSYYNQHARELWNNSRIDGTLLNL